MRERVRAHVDEKNKLLKYVLESKAHVDFDQLWAQLEREAEILAPFVGNGSRLIFDALRRNEKVIFEGAQGVLLDQVHGTYPFVTSSSTIAGSATIGVGIGPKMIDSVLGIAKAYCTRVGEGPFPTEMLGELGDEVRKRGHEFGTVTGRARRCGWFDVVAMKRAIRTSGIDSVILTKLDVLSGLPTLKLGTGYKRGDELVDDLPPSSEDYEGLEAVYFEVPGWAEDISGVRTWEGLPKTVHGFVETLTRLLECPVSFVSVGPGREATIPVAPPPVVKEFLA
jgi:adenylosuccinate synthase